jgi:hypothetical protein
MSQDIREKLYLAWLGDYIRARGQSPSVAEAFEAGLAAIPAAPVVPARLLTEDEAKDCMDWTLLNTEVEAIQRKFCEVNGIPLAAVPAAVDLTPLTDDQLADLVPQTATVLEVEGQRKKVCMTRAELHEFAKAVRAGSAAVAPIQPHPLQPLSDLVAEELDAEEAALAEKQGGIQEPTADKGNLTSDSVACGLPPATSGGHE